MLQQHCDAVGRDISEIEFTLGAKPVIRDSQAEAERFWRGEHGAQQDALANVEDDVDLLERHARSRSRSVWRRTSSWASTTCCWRCRRPFDQETLERIITEVKPLIERG